MQTLLFTSFYWVKANIPFLVLLFFLCAIYFILRIVVIRDLPLFIDEAIYIRWAQMGLYDPSLRLTSLSDGKQPLFIWLVTACMQFTSNPLAAGRMVSIQTGFLTAIGLYLLASQLFKEKWVSILTVTFYVILPFSLVFNRMALYESTSGMFLVWSLLLAVVLTQKLQLHYSFILALVMGGGILTKTTGFLSIYLLPVLLILLPFTKTNRVNRLFTWAALFIVAVGVSLLYYLILQLSPNFYQIDEKNAIFIYHLRELIPYGALYKWAPNVLTLISWTALYFSIPAFVIFICSLFFIRKNWRQKTVLLWWFVIPFVAYALMGRQLNARYLYPIVLPLLPLFAACLIDAYEKIKLRKGVLVAISICIISMLYVDYRILTSFATSPIPQDDLDQYSNSASAGGGIKESIVFLSQKAEEGSLYIATEGIYGSLPTTAMEIYFLHHPGVQKGGFEVSQKLPKLLAEKAHEMPVYIIFNQTQNIPPWPMEKIAEYRKGVSDQYLRIYLLQKK